MRAMVLAAGFGKRLRPITLTRPKPLVEVAGRTLLDRTLDQLGRGGVNHAVVNIHYLGEQIMAHAAIADHPVYMEISDEREKVLETGGGIVKALPKLGQAPFVAINADTFWVEKAGIEPTVTKMAKTFDAQRMDMLLLVCSPEQAIGHSGGLDFIIDRDGRLSRADKAKSGYIYAGAAIINPAIFKKAEAVSHSLNRYFDAAKKKGRLFGQALENAYWYTVSTPDSLKAVEAHLRDHGDMAPLSRNES
ncbi:MAG: nucleotidyltransferase family protein [Pseudomonadota bacterium]